MKKNELFYTRTIVGLLALASAVLFGSCDREVITEDETQTAVLFRVNAETNAASTRVVGITNETTIHTVDVLLFQDGGYVRTVRGTHIDDSSFIAMIEEGETFDAEVLVNARDLIPATLSEGAAKADVLASLLTKASDYLPNTASSIPAWGEVKNLTATKGASFGVDLLRMMARVDVVLSETAASKFTITDVYLYKYNTVGSVVPSALDTEATTPTVPSSSTLSATALHYESSPIYLYESKITTAANTPAAYRERTCLVVGGTYEGKKTYYRMDFVKKGDTDTWYDVLRNHKYTFTVTDVTGAGDDTPDDAWKDVAVNVQFDVLEWSTDSYGDIVLNGVQYLSVSPSSFDLYSDSSVQTLRISTNVKSWSIQLVDNIDTEDSLWIKSVTPIQGATTDGTDVSFQVTKLNEDVDTVKNFVRIRTGYLLITAGMLQYKVSVTQSPHFAYSNVVLKDGKLTFAATAADNAEIPADVQGLYFLWGSLMGINMLPSHPYTAANVVFIPPGYSGATPTDNLYSIPWNPQGDDLVYYDDNIGSSQFGYMRAAYDVSAGVGDVCAFISDKGWVKGRWRLPTMKEMCYVFMGDEEKDNYSILSADIPTPTANDGTNRIGSGQFRGTTTTNADYLTGKMPPHVVFFPASGYMYISSSLSYFARSSEYLTSNITNMSTRISHTEVKFILPGSESGGIVSTEGGSGFNGATIRCLRVGD
jgi:hypothetical protein